MIARRVGWILGAQLALIALVGARGFRATCGTAPMTRGPSRRLTLRLTGHGRVELRRHPRRGRSVRVLFTLTDADWVTATAQRRTPLLRAVPVRRSG